MRKKFTPAIIALVFIGCFTGNGGAQSLRLQLAGSTSDRATVQVGQTINIEVFADLGRVEAAGIAFHITLPSDAFAVIDQSPEGIFGVQPFLQGPLFEGAGEQINLLLPESDPSAANFEGQQLDYAAVIGAAGQRTRSGAGVIATFRLLCLRPIANGRIDVDDNPVRETRLVLPGGEERRFLTVRGMEITVTGLQLRDIPDVILYPGQADSIQIGSLTKYVASTLVPPDSIRWSFDLPDVDPAVKRDFLEDSLAVEIEQLSNRVKITPMNDWVGRQRIIWTATEPSGLIPGQDPNQTTDFSDIVVNNPPVFAILPGLDAVKRDTIRIIEDANPFNPGLKPDPRVAFRGRDLDQIVDDPGVVDPQRELNYTVLPYGSLDAVNVRGDDDPNTHELLVWSRQNYFGVDSLKVVVLDMFRGQDSLRVIIEVIESPDPPEWILQDREPKVSRGGTRSYLLRDIARDVDTPLDSLELSWIDDPEGHFTTDTTRTEAGLVISIKGAPDFTGLGRVTFQLADPSDPDNLSETMMILITAGEALPPVVFPPEIEVRLITGGESVNENLDDFADDPDNIDSELAWSIPSATKTVFGIDENRVLSASAPLEFVGYEEAILVVSDPSNQSDDLKLRIYSSDGTPVVGGLPDLILDRGQQHSEIDLDGYYYDSDNTDEEMNWRVVDSFDANNLQVGIDPLTHVVTFLVDERALFRTEAVIFRVQSPEGISAQDTMLVTIRSGGAPGGEGVFQIRAFPSDLQVPVGTFITVLDLDNFVQAPAEFPLESLTWNVAVIGGEHTIPAIGRGNVVELFGVSSGTDTISFTAYDSLGNSDTQTVFVRAFGENEILKLLPLPDVQFVAGSSYQDSLNKFIVDRSAHPDSFVLWRIDATLNATGNIFPRVRNGNVLFAAAPDTGEIEVVLVARDTLLNVSGRDTVKIISIDPAHAFVPLKELPPIVLLSGQADSTVMLNEFLPDEVSNPAETIWRVSGQKITSPAIGIDPPHRLTVQSVGNRLGVDTLSFVVNLGGGRTASGTMEVTVQEPVDEATLELQVVPNMFNQEFIDVYVLARRVIAGTPNVVRTFEGADSTVAVRQIEEDMEGRRVLVWSGNVQLPPGATGTIFFTAQALTSLGTPVGDTASVTVFTTVAAKVAVIEHEGIELRLGADAVREGTRIIMQVEEGKLIDGAAKIAPEGELKLRSLIGVYPMGTELRRHSTLRLPPGPSTEGLYKKGDDEWYFLGARGDRVPIEQLARYAVFNDPVPPLVVLHPQAGRNDNFAARLIDRGSGIDLSSIKLLVNGEPANAEFQNGLLRWLRDDTYPGGATEIVINVEDRAGNRASETFAVHLPVQSQPVAFSLGANYPNPFNPETTIPFAVPVESASSSVRVSIYNVSGQLVRRLVNSDVGPGQHELTWDAKDETGNRVSSGVYFYRLEARNAIRTRSMMLLK